MWKAFFILLFSTITHAEHRILIMGDSLSAAYQIPVQTAWPSLLASRVEDCPTPITVINESISGETSTGGKNRLANLLAQHHPSLVMIALGANDALRGQPMQQLQTNLADMISMVRKSQAEPVLLGMTIPVNYGTRYREALRQVYADLAQAENIPYHPFFLEGVAEDLNNMLPDGLHPNSASQPRILENVWSVIAPLLDCENISGAAAK